MLTLLSNLYANRSPYANMTFYANLDLYANLALLTTLLSVLTLLREGVSAAGKSGFSVWLRISSHASGLVASLALLTFGQFILLQNK